VASALRTSSARHYDAAVRSNGSLHVLGVSYADSSDWREPLPQGKWSQFFGALSSRLHIIDVIRPQLSPPGRYLNLARSFRPSMSAWKARASFNRRLASALSAEVQLGLQAHAGTVDLIMQLQTMFAPGVERAGVPYAIYTDNTWAITRRFYPEAQGRGAEADWRIGFEQEICRGASAVFTFSQFARSSVIADYGCNEQDVIAVGAGANQILDSLDGVERDPSSPRALFVGIDFVRKGGLVLLDAWQRVRERVPEAELLIAGPREAPRRAMPAGVEWLGRLDRAHLSQLYRSASVFVLPSLFDPGPFVFFEAMGHGLPCIGTRCCGIPELIDDGSTGVLVESNDAEQLAQALVELLADPAKAAAMGRAGHAKVLDGNRWTDVADRVVAHLEG
jgi:glycosyltransferase involved in cell wall biosynthesis